MNIPTMAVRLKDGSEAIINVTDFDPAIHQNPAEKGPGSPESASETPEGPPASPEENAPETPSEEKTPEMPPEMPKKTPRPRERVR